MPLGEDNPMPILEVVLRQLARYGFDDVIIITGYLTEYIETFCRDGRRFGTRVSYRRETVPLGTAGGLTLVDRPRDPVLVLNGDILTTLDFAAMYADHARTGADATIAAYTREVAIDFGVLEFGEDPTRLVGYREKPRLTFEVSMGLYLLSPVAWDYLKPGVAVTMPELLESMRRSGCVVRAYRQPCEWLDIGRHDDYAAANELFQARRQEFLGSSQRPRLKIG
jgi:NDP-sugar pyrophosphorylase family protein